MPRFGGLTPNCAPRKFQHMQWEYKIVALGLIVDATEQNQRERHARILNDLGREDWEAVAYIAQSSTVLLKGPAKASYR